jgi:MerR HTH family regulatory protein
MGTRTRATHVAKLSTPSVAVIECLETAAVARLASVNRSTLDYWVRTGLVAPSLRDAPGRRRTRLWTVSDAVVVRAVAHLRLAGCPLQQVRRARVAIEDRFGRFGADATLVWNGSDVLKIDHEGKVESILKYPGQQVFRPVALPIGAWQDETSDSILYIREDDLVVGVPRATRELAMKAGAR